MQHPLVRPVLSPEDAVADDPTWPLTDSIDPATWLADSPEQMALRTTAHASAGRLLGRGDEG